MVENKNQVVIRLEKKKEEKKEEKFLNNLLQQYITL